MKLTFKQNSTKEKRGICGISEDTEIYFKNLSRFFASFSRVSRQKLVKTGALRHEKPLK